MESGREMVLSLWASETRESAQPNMTLVLVTQLCHFFLTGTTLYSAFSLSIELLVGLEEV
eukprot:m.8760 g.8760  ORF g.8760 m.8760 type:complete len:60 (-) comp5529_c0_seq1:71-250(-)